jgi:hypothetical protein
MLGYYEGWPQTATPLTGVLVRGAALNKLKATHVYDRGNGDGIKTAIRYHDTDVVTIYSDCVVLNTGGWFTVTTKRRMNQASKEYNLGFSVWSKQGRWFVTKDNYSYAFGVNTRAKVPR